MKSPMVVARSSWSARAWTAISAVVAALMLWSAAAYAYAPPPQQAQHVVDAAGKLAPAQKAIMEQKLESIRLETKRDIVVFLARSLEGESVEDVAYATFNAWKLGEKGADTGVLLLVSPAERKVRIESGKGVGGELTDLQCAEIIRAKIAPALKEDRFFDAVNDGTDAIAKALAAGVGKAAAPRPAPSVASVFLPFGLAVLVILVLMALFIALDQYLRRKGHRGFNVGGGGGGGGSSGHGGGGSSSGGGYGGGGGGQSGGGGASGDY
jgi:uncharacterized protein